MTPRAMSIFRFVVIPLVFLFVLSKPSDYITALFYKQAWWLWVVEDCLTVITILIGSEGGLLITHRLERYISWEQGLVKRFVVQIVLQGMWFTVAAWSGQMLNEWCFDRHTPNKILLLQVSRTVALALFFYDCSHTFSDVSAFAKTSFGNRRTQTRKHLGAGRGVEAPA